MISLLLVLKYFSDTLSSKEVSKCEDSLEPIQIDAENRLNEYKTNLLKLFGN